MFQIGYHLAKIEFDISGPSIQMFPILHDMNFMAQHVMVKFNSNWGEEYTCVYRVRVHGDIEWKINLLKPYTTVTAEQLHNKWPISSYLGLISLEFT